MGLAGGLSLSFHYIDTYQYMPYNLYIDIFRYEVIPIKHNHIDNAKVFKAFCDENRLAILELLKSGEKCACDLLDKLSISQPTLSHHMKILAESGIVAARKEGRWVYYSIRAKGCENAAELLKKLTAILESRTEDCCI